VARGLQSFGRRPNGGVRLRLVSNLALVLFTAFTFLHGPISLADGLSDCNVELHIEGLGYLSGQVLRVDHVASGDTHMDVLRVKVPFEGGNFGIAGILIERKHITNNEGTLVKAGDNIIVPTVQLAHLSHQEASILLDPEFQEMKPQLFSYRGSVAIEILNKVE
jgi:hypothetical protein